MGVLSGYFTTFLSLILLLVLQTTDCATVVVDRVTQWKDPTANIGDTIIFKHRNQYNLYIFRTKDAYNSCNFTQAYPLSNLNSNSSTYTWHPSRRGSFYFGFYNNTNIPCQQGQKLTIKVVTTTTTTAPPPSSPPAESEAPTTPGGQVSSSPSYPWPFQPREKQGAGVGASPGPSYTDVGIAPMSPAMSPEMSSIPFINSNPAVPLPTGEVDSATIQPLPTPANHSSLSQAVKLGSFIEGVMISLCYVIIVMVIVV